MSVQLLHGGRSVNRNLRITTRVGRFVLRQRIREGPRPGADPLRDVLTRFGAGASQQAAVPPPAGLQAPPPGYQPPPPGSQPPAYGAPTRLQPGGPVQQQSLPPPQR